VKARVCEARERTGWGPRLIAGETGVPHFTVHAILRRHGRSRTPRAAKAKFVRYQWPCPGDLLHMDVKRYPRFRRPGHAVTGDRRVTLKNKINPLGHDYFHAIVVDHSRLAYGELLADEKAATDTGFLKRALAWFAEREITSRRLMTDGAWSLHPQPHATRAAHRPRDPAHRHTALHATLKRQGRTLPPNHRARVGQRHPLPQQHRAQPSAATLAALLQRTQTHSSLSDRPPISRARNLSGQDS
jgi:hypothetical protein